jgi:hypothetical protein
MNAYTELFLTLRKIDILNIKERFKEINFVPSDRLEEINFVRSSCIVNKKAKGKRQKEETATCSYL